MVGRDHKLSVRRQCALQTLTRSDLWSQPMGESTENLRFMAIIDRRFPDMPWYGTRPPSGIAHDILPGDGSRQPVHRRGLDWRSERCEDRDQQASGWFCKSPVGNGWHSSLARKPLPGDGQMHDRASAAVP